jgi:hypothetical protein
MTELEAINTLLGVIGEAPIDRLSDISINEITDSALARRTLHEVSRDVQAEGWSWNTDGNVQLQKDNQNQFPLPDNTLSAVFSPNRYPDNRYVARGNRVYQRYERRFDFGKDMTAPLWVDQLVTQLPWEELPHAAQQYITIRAARIYSDRFVNSNLIYTYTAQDEEYARTMLIRAEERSGSNNMLWGNDRGMGSGLGYIPAEGTRFRTH